MTKFSAVNLTLAGAICMSFVGLLIRLIESADGFQILFYRSIGMSLVILTLVCLRRNKSPFRVLKSLDRKIVLNSMILKWDIIKDEFKNLIQF